MELLDAEGRRGGAGSSVSGEAGQRRGELREPRGEAMAADEDGSGGGGASSASRRRGGGGRARS